MIAMTTEPVDFILNGLGLIGLVVFAFWYTRSVRRDPWKEAALTSRARQHGASVRAARRERRQRHCSHPPTRLITRYHGGPKGPITGQWCGRCGKTLGDNGGAPLRFWRASL